MPNRIPPYLKKYVSYQNYQAYTAREQATWSFIMSRAAPFFSKHALPIYNEALSKTGIPLNCIPKIDEMSEKLARFSWSAVGVNGFIPSSVFLDFLARRILPIATGMRSIDHFAYTSAPDIVHEAAGHAPMIADSDYRLFLESYADVALKAVVSRADIVLFELIRLLSDSKENPDYTSSQIESAEMRLKAAYLEQELKLSEATKLARLAWWTIEYGLVQSAERKDEFLIYGAGLLSSIGEGRTGLQEAVAKIPLTEDCVFQAYDITEPQPQLFYVDNLSLLPSVLNSVSSSFAFRKKGCDALGSISGAATINTLVFEGGFSISGDVENFHPDGDRSDCIDALALRGRLQFCYQGKEIFQFVFSHSLDLGKTNWLPVGTPRTLNSKPLTASSLDSLGFNRAGLMQEKKEKVLIEMRSGLLLEGLCHGFAGLKERVSGLFLSQLRVRNSAFDHELIEKLSRTSVVLIPMESKILQAYGGPEDRQAFGDYDVGKIESTPERQSPYSDREKNLFYRYQRFNEIFDGPPNQNKDWNEFKSVVDREILDIETDWLLDLKLKIYAQKQFGASGIDRGWTQMMHQRISEKIKNLDKNSRELVAEVLG